MTLWTKKPRNVKKDIQQQACYKIYTQHYSISHHCTYIFFLLYTLQRKQTNKQTNKLYTQPLVISNLQHQPTFFGYHQFTTQANTLWLSATYNTSRQKKHTHTVLLSAIYNTKIHTVLLSPIYNTSQHSFANTNLQHKPTLFC